MKIGKFKQVSSFPGFTSWAAFVLLQVGVAGLAFPLDAVPPVPLPGGLRLPLGDFFPGLSLGGGDVNQALKCYNYSHMSLFKFLDVYEAKGRVNSYQPFNLIY